MDLINLTPHTLNLHTAHGVQEVPASGQLARVRSTPELVGAVAGLPVYRDTFGVVEGLPAPQDGVAYLVSGLVLSALKDAGAARPDVLAPGTGPQDGAVRNERGQVVGATRLKSA